MRQEKNVQECGEALRGHASLSVAIAMRKYIAVLSKPHACLRHFPGIRFSLAKIILKQACPTISKHFESIVLIYIDCKFIYEVTHAI